MTSGGAHRQQEDQDHDDGHHQAEQALGGQALDRASRRTAPGRTMTVSSAPEPRLPGRRACRGPRARSPPRCRPARRSPRCRGCRAVGAGERGGRRPSCWSTVGDVAEPDRAPRAAGRGKALQVARAEAIGVPTWTVSARRAVGDRAGRDGHAVGLQQPRRPRAGSTPAAASLRRSGVITTCCSRAPVTCDVADALDRLAAPAPRSGSSRSASVAARRRRRTRRARSPGCRRCCRRRRSGRRRRAAAASIRLIEVCIWLTASSRSVPNSNSTWMVGRALAGRRGDLVQAGDAL